VLAPTGTIGFMMDCDTTGIEPDFSLVKFKKLVGGGSMQIVNQTIQRGLKKLGYVDEQAEAIISYISEYGHVVDAPGLKIEHYEVFDTAMGARALKPMGHVRMMAATQPFLSGAISKTVNLPESATVEDVEDVYFQSWKLGLKSVGVYRDNCKLGRRATISSAQVADESLAVERQEAGQEGQATASAPIPALLLGGRRVNDLSGGTPQTRIPRRSAHLSIFVLGAQVACGFALAVVFAQKGILVAAAAAGVVSSVTAVLALAHRFRGVRRGLSGNAPQERDLVLQSSDVIAELRSRNEAVLVGIARITDADR